MFWKNLMGVTVAVAVCPAAVGCRDDVVLPPKPSLVGRYVGVYVYKTGQGDGADSLVQAVLFKFGESTYNMSTDQSSPLYTDTVCFCLADGTYGITDRVRLEPRDASVTQPDNCDTCDPAQSPQGSYTLEQPPGGIKLTWIQTIDDKIITSRLDLTRVSD